MQYRTASVQFRFRTVWKLDRTDSGHVGYRTRQVQDKTNQNQDRTDAVQDECRK